MVVLGGVGIGLSSLDALLQTLPPNTLPALLEEMIHAGHAHGHSHSHGPAVGADPMALWIAGASIGVKEWLFRASIIPNIIPWAFLMVAKKVAGETNSTVLLANVPPPSPPPFFCYPIFITPSSNPTFITPSPPNSYPTMLPLLSP